LPNAERAVIETLKVTRYLLDPTNPDSRGKPEFFFQFGFTVEGWQTLASAFQEHARQCDVTSTETTEFGVKYRIVGALTTPDGRSPIVRAVWIVLHGDDVPRFVTAVPHERRRR